MKDGLESLGPAFEELYDELRSIAAACLRRERPGHTLQPTALVHEAYLRLFALNRIEWQNRAHVLGVAAQMMRQILVSHARRRQTLKRASPSTAIQLPADNGREAEVCDALAVHEALTRLEGAHPAPAKVVELRFFGGLTEEECADWMELSRATVQRQYAFARAWLLRELNDSRVGS
jgi:RNA polymerase sigma factor (TIGR02999 family)